MKIFAAEFMDSQAKPRLLTTINKLLYTPPIANLGSTIMVMIEAHMGVQQAMKKDDIPTTILATFLSRLDELSTCPTFADFTRHSVFFQSSTTRMKVQTIMMKNALNWTRTVFTAKFMTPAISWSVVEIRQTIVLFLVEEDIPSLLM